MLVTEILPTPVYRAKFWDRISAWWVALERFTFRIEAYDVRFVDL